MTVTEHDVHEAERTSGWSRRRVLTGVLGGLAGLAGAGAAGFELVEHGVLPGKQELDQLDGACSVAAPPLRFRPPGPSRSGTFLSRARHRPVGYTAAWPPGHHPGDALPLVVMLHGFGADHTNTLTSMSPAQAVALEVDGVPLPPMAMVTVDGGGGYWNPHPHDDPMQMVVGELVPMCQALNLGRAPQRIGTMGISMGGYGALLLAEKYPGLFAAVAAISPAVWTKYRAGRTRPTRARTHRRPTSRRTTRSPMRGRWPTRPSASPRVSMIPSTPAWSHWRGHCRNRPSWTSRRVATPDPSSPRRNPPHWPSWARISPRRADRAGPTIGPSQSGGEVAEWRRSC